MPDIKKRVMETEATNPKKEKKPKVSTKPRFANDGHKRPKKKGSNSLGTKMTRFYRSQGKLP